MVGQDGQKGCEQRDGMAGKSTEGFEDVCERIKPAPSRSHCSALEQVQSNLPAPPFYAPNTWAWPFLLLLLSLDINPPSLPALCGASWVLPEARQSLPSLPSLCSLSPPQGLPQPCTPQFPQGMFPSALEDARTPLGSPSPFSPWGEAHPSPVAPLLPWGGFQTGFEVCRKCLDRVLVSKARGIPPLLPPPPQAGHGCAGDVNEAPQVCTTLQK